MSASSRCCGPGLLHERLQQNENEELVSMVTSAFSGLACSSGVSCSGDAIARFHSVCAQKRALQSLVELC